MHYKMFSCAASFIFRAQNLLGLIYNKSWVTPSYKKQKRQAGVGITSNKT